MREMIYCKPFRYPVGVLALSKSDGNNVEAAVQTHECLHADSEV